MSPMERTLKELKANPDCLRCRKVEHWNAFAHRRVDLWGADVQALFKTHILAIQVTSMTDNAAHIRAALESEDVRDWVYAGGRFEVWAWRKLAKEGWKALKTPVGPETWRTEE